MGNKQSSKEQPETTENDSIYVIGLQNSGEFGINNNQKCYDLISFSKHHQKKNITQIHSGNKTTIYSNFEEENFWIAGCGNKCNELNEITFFKENNIKIIKVCLTVIGHYTFWISNDDKLYGNAYDLGLNKSIDKNKPNLIPDLHGVIDMKSSDEHSLALCSNYYMVSMIILNWYQQSIPYDLNNLISIFYSRNRVYSTIANYNKSKWDKIATFNDKHIIQIAAGSNHHLFLEKNGILWCCGTNDSGQLGIASNRIWSKSYNPIKINYFITNKIKIQEIRCGWKHNLVIDDNHCIYSWGDNYYGQCGDGTTKNLNKPQIIDTLKDMNVIEIECGSWHCYAKTEDKKHYLWGLNMHNECISNQHKKITLPFCINHVIKQKTNGKIIKSVSLGYNNTKFILCNASSN